ncbi:hypothetical protein SBA5_880047 [Candidatus Sulfotelmatomonas gaucii]|uniref:Uncharacterized protein n=1 Tax=Candidatus Sulfuritelmatomonas gaucii TaxID=2043161 RepID=A0A2N9M7D5_9BACT|nr:hypothetical protein SBA5_880047 [Candidatus Sulfotelmatomonas gaucii]
MGSPVVSTAQTQAELPHRNAKQDCGQHVPHLVEQQASRERSSDYKAKPQSIKPDAEEDAKGKQKPSRIVHPEWNHKSAHASTFAQPQVSKMRNFARSAFGQFHCRRCTKP